MKNTGKFKKINTKSHTYYCFGDINTFEDFDLDILLIDKKSYESIWIYNISNIN